MSDNKNCINCIIVDVFGFLWKAMHQYSMSSSKQFQKLLNWNEGYQSDTLI